MLIMIVIDVLNTMLLCAVDLGLLHRLTRRHTASSVFLYSDDVVIFCHPDAHDLDAVREILRIFGVASGLHTNYTKCSISPIRCSDEMSEEVSTALACPITQFPITYLGLPLDAKCITIDGLAPRWTKVGGRVCP